METKLLPNGPSAPVIVTGDVWHGFRARYTPLAATADTITDPDIARTTRLKIRAVRCEAENTRKELVAGLNKELGTINEKARGFREECEATEATLREIEEAAERQAARVKIELAAARGEMLAKLGINGAAYPLGGMSQDDFEALHDGLKAAHEEKEKRRLEAEHARLLAEKAAADERERIRVENERLRAEAAEKEAALKAEREEADRQRKAAEEAARKEREAMAAAAKALQEKREASFKAEMDAQARQRKAEIAAALKKQEAAEAKLRAEKEESDRMALAQKEALEAKAFEERKAREAIEADVRTKAAAEEANRRQEAEERAAAAKAPDREKLLAFAQQIRALEFPKMATEDGAKVLSTIETKCAEFAGWIEKRAEGM